MEKILKKLVRPERAVLYAPYLAAVFADKIPYHFEQAHFLTQILFESGNLRVTVENMNYSAERLLKVFPNHFSSIEHARKYEHNPKAIGNKVYANRNGNGDADSGDGYRYRGRGFIQVTFKNSYRAFAKWIGDESLLFTPGQVAKKYPVESAVWFWESRNLGRFALDKGHNVADYKESVSEITYRVNGSRRSVNDRYKVFKKVFEAMELG